MYAVDEAPRFTLSPVKPYRAYYDHTVCKVFCLNAILPYLRVWQGDGGERNGQYLKR